jgi:O-antigen/teichoic acid export membrane protein
MFKLFKVLCSGVGAAGATFLLQVFLSHKLTMHDFGIYVAASSSLTMIGPFAGMGIGGLFLRKICVNEDKVDKYFSIALKCLLINMLIAFLCSQFIFLNTGLSGFQALCLSSYFLPISVQYLLLSNAQAFDNIYEVSLSQITMPFLRLFLILFLLIFTPSLTNTVFLLSISNIAAFLIISLVISRHISFRLIFLKQKATELFSFFRESIFYSFNSSINVIQIQFSVLMAIFYFGANTSSLYSSAITLLTATYILPNMVFGTYLLPQYHKLEKIELKNTAINYAIKAFLVGFFFSMALVVSSDLIIGALYPSSFKKAVLLLSILAFSLPFRFFSTAIGAALLNEKCIKQKVFSSFMSVFAQVSLVYFFHKLGEESIALSFVFSEVFTCLLYFIIFVNYFKIKFTI